MVSVPPVCPGRCPWVPTGNSILSVVLIINLAPVTSVEVVAELPITT